MVFPFSFTFCILKREIAHCCVCETNWDPQRIGAIRCAAALSMFRVQTICCESYSFNKFLTS